MQNNLQIHNNSHEPTYRGYNAQSCIDVVISRDLPLEIENWRVVDTYNGSDHNTVRFRINYWQSDENLSRARNRTDWPKFTEVLSTKKVYIPEFIDQRKLDKLVSKFYYEINSALDKSGKMVGSKRTEK